MNPKHYDLIVVGGGMTGAAAIEKFLKSGIFKGVGEVTARNIVERFGERTLDVMKTSPEKLAEVKGISAKKAAEICASTKARPSQRMISFTLI